MKSIMRMCVLGGLVISLFACANLNSKERVDCPECHYRFERVVDQRTGCPSCGYEF